MQDGKPSQLFWGIMRIDNSLTNNKTTGEWKEPKRRDESTICSDNVD